MCIFVCKTIETNSDFANKPWLILHTGPLIDMFVIRHSEGEQFYVKLSAYPAKKDW